MKNPDCSSRTRPKQRPIDEELDKAIEEFRIQLFHKTPDDLKRKGSCLRLKESAIKIASLLVEATDQQELPIDLRPICRRMLIHTMVPDTELSSYISELTPDSRGFTVRISGKQTGIRRRIALAHEIGHTLFYDSTRLSPVRIFADASHNAQTDKQEWISWDFARELLLPTKLISGELLQSPCPSAQEVVSHARKWGVSVEFLCHRVMRDLGVWKHCALFTCSLNGVQMNRASVRIYRGTDFPRFPLLGREGLLTSSEEFGALAGALQRSEEVEESFDWKGFQMWVQLLKYWETPSRVMGILEIPASFAREDISECV